MERASQDKQMRSAISAALPISSHWQLASFPLILCKKLSMCTSSTSTPANVHFSLCIITAAVNAQASGTAKHPWGKYHISTTIHSSEEVKTPLQSSGSSRYSTLPTRRQQRLQICLAESRSSQILCSQKQDSVGCRWDGSEESWERRSHLSGTYQTTDISSPPPIPSLREKEAELHYRKKQWCHSSPIQHYLTILKDVAHQSTSD